VWRHLLGSRDGPRCPGLRGARPAGELCLAVGVAPAADRCRRHPLRDTGPVPARRAQPPAPGRHLVARPGQETMITIREQTTGTVLFQVEAETLVGANLRGQ